MIKHIVMFKLKDAEGRSEYENALEAQKRFDNVIANVKELRKGEVVINSKDAPESNYTISPGGEMIDDVSNPVGIDRFVIGGFSEAAGYAAE